MSDNGRQDPFGDKHGLGRVAVTALCLGLVCGAHLVILVESSSRRTTAWALYVVVVCSFHFLEFLSTALYKWRDLSFDSFLVNHSTAYSAALAAGVGEFWVEVPFFSPSIPAIVAGLAIVLAGQTLRFVAMATAREHFAHRIMTRRDASHRLVTHGVYAFLRHPAYTGWFWWSIGTQILLANPVCTLAYAWASWAFFNDRIPFEEATLASFYPDEYPAYARATWVAIPFIASEYS
ncbi:hypothetical protein CTAYLR_005644 [Chrysophaeum taylorii]|uniref:Protein-S-isoprenylcysteine O-methyltransferase n=1 Tax=Chrysophaeum taylorii TaxID=2483200 RepID=A0AAD7XLZ6_9STRA|nr:hypothetical protein CTAYLR_005644 [Chrysophaeum taylorii]